MKSRGVVANDTSAIKTERDSTTRDANFQFRKTNQNRQRIKILPN